MNKSTACNILIACGQKRKPLMVAASSIAAVRTAREQKIVPESWAITNGVDDSVRLAEMVLKRIERDSDGKADERYLRSFEETP